MRTRQRGQVISRRRSRFLTVTAMVIATEVTVSSVLASSAFAKSTKDVRRHRAEVREPIPSAGNGQQRWPGARYDQNGYYIDPNSPGRW
jgi:hypothetical protein